MVGGFYLRFLRGLGLGILMFFIWAVASVFAALSLIGEYGLDTDPDFANIPPIFSIPMIIGFFGMFIGPLYYWVIEPLRERGKPPKQTYYQPTQQFVHPTPGQQPAAFCQQCGTKNPQGQQFCGNCGANLLLG